MSAHPAGALIAETVAILARAMLCGTCGGNPTGVCPACLNTREQWRDIGCGGNDGERRIMARISARREGPWENSAECRGMDPNLFFPAIGQHASVAALAACARCPVRAECYAAAVAGREHGVWGGTTEDERKGKPRKAPATSRQGRRAAAKGPAELAEDAAA